MHAISKPKYNNPPALCRCISYQKYLLTAAFITFQNVITTSPVRSTMGIFHLSVTLGARKILDKHPWRFKLST